MIKSPLMILLMIFITSSCKISRKLVCKQIENSRMKPMIHRDLSIKFQRCRIRCFNFNTMKTIKDKHCGDDFRSGNYGMEMCHGLAGFLNDDWAIELKPKVKKLNNLHYNLCR